MNKETDQYIPGICNIGTDEVAKRKIECVVGLIVTLLVTAAVFYFYTSRLLWLLLFFSSSYTALMYLQISNRFCVLFGWIHRYNFGRLGNLEKINDPVQRARDRKKIVSMGLQMLVISVFYAGLIYFITRRFHF